jgi:hypothetical protein
MKGLDIVATSTSGWFFNSRKAKIEQLETCVDISIIIFEQPTTRQNKSARLAQHVIDIMLVIMRLHHACWMPDNLDFVLILSNSFRSLKRMRGKDNHAGRKDEVASICRASRILSSKSGKLHSICSRVLDVSIGEMISKPC